MPFRTTWVRSTTKTSEIFAWFSTLVVAALLSFPFQRSTAQERTENDERLPAAEAEDLSYSETEERKAWILALKKFAQEERGSSFDLTTAVSVSVPALVTLLVLYFTFRNERARETARMQHELDLKEKETQREVELANQVSGTNFAGKLLDLRIEQLESFFAPLHSLLQQSKGVYQKLLLELCHNQDKYRQVPDPNRGPTVKKLQVKHSDGEWYDWRLLDELPVVKNDPQVKPLVAELMRIGEKASDLIAQKGAFSVDEQGVSPIYGEYLAHFAILNGIYKDERTEPYPPGFHRVGYFPRGLDETVSERYRFLRQELQRYLEASNAVLNHFQEKSGSNVGSN